MERSELENCVKQLIDDIRTSSFTALTKIMKGVQYENMINSSHQAASSNGLFQRFWQWSKMSFSSPITGHTLVHGIQLLHNEVKRDLLDI
ncbi:hypothetical protein Bca101_054952 [Brassica carinata]